MGIRRRSREIALQVLYQMDLNPVSAEEALQLYENQVGIPGEAYTFTQFLVLGVDGNRSEIDQLIESASRHWRLNRMPVVDRNVIRIAVFEIRYCDNIPSRVSINEAIELAKKFGSEDSKAFVNGVLDKIYNLQQTNGEKAS